MNIHERQNNILALLSENKHINVEELSRHFGVSAVTIRKDLRNLETRGLLRRNYGGAVVNDHFEHVASYTHRSTLLNEIKDRIGKKAAEFIQPNDAVMIDGGTTTYAAARHIGAISPLTVVTTSLAVCNLFINYPDISVVISGGVVVGENLTIKSHSALNFISNYHTNVAVIGISAYSLNQGFTTSDELAAATKQTMIACSQKVIAVADSSKFNKVAFVTSCYPSDIDVLITDEGIPDDICEAMEKSNVQVVIV